MFSPLVGFRNYPIKRNLKVLANTVEEIEEIEEPRIADTKRSISIKGYSYDPDCMYVNGTGRDYYEFYIQLNRCGTLGENTHHQDSRKNPTVRKTSV